MMRSWHGNWICGAGSFFGGPWGWLIDLLFWLAVILLAVWLARALTSQRGKGHSARPSPLEVLKQRYAAGEIGREEFERMKGEILQEA